jgi:hypothetical protein
MLSLEGAASNAREKYFDYVADAWRDRSEPIESDEQAQAEIASDLSEALDKHRCEIGKGETSFLLVCRCFHMVYGPGLDLFSSLLFSSLLFSSLLFSSLASPLVETFDAYDHLQAHKLRDG